MPLFRKLSLSVLVGVAWIAASATPASAASNWAYIGCANLPQYPGAKICFYYDANNNHYGQGRFYNNSSSNIKNQGFFLNSSYGYDCGLVTTNRGTTSTCTRALSARSWHLEDDYYGHYVITASHGFS